MNYLLDLERTLSFGVPYFWKPNKRGYTHVLEDAGLYSDLQAQEIFSSDLDKHTVIIPKAVVDKILREG